MPFPSSELFPSPNLFPGEGGGIFTALLLKAFAPWLPQDTNQNLYTYLTALGSMFDPVANIVTDIGFAQDPTVSTWAAMTFYDQGNVVFGSDGKAYASLYEGNQGHDPVDDDGTNWLPSPVTSTFYPAWSQLLDPDLCPDPLLPYLGQFIGVSLPPGIDPDVGRERIKQEAGFQRGTVAAVTWAVQQNLTGPENVMILERQDIHGAPDAYHFVILIFPGTSVVDFDMLTEMVDAVKPAGVLWSLIIATGWLWSQAIHTWSADTMRWIQTATIQP